MERIEALETEAGQAGDLLQAAICQIALYGEPNPRTYAALSTDERYALHKRYGKRNGWRKAAAIAECKRVIADAAARAETEEKMNKRRVYGIKNPDGHWYTGDLVGGRAKFSPRQDDAIELDEEEATDEVRMHYMPEGVQVAVLYEYDAK